MSESSKEIVERLRQQIEHLMNQYSRLEERCASLEEENKKLQADLSKERDASKQLSNSLSKCKMQYEKLQMSQKTALSVAQARENKERFAQLVREIDKCISLLQE